MGSICVKRQSVDYGTFIKKKLHFGAKVKDNVVVFVTAEISK